MVQGELLSFRSVLCIMTNSWHSNVVTPRYEQASLELIYTRRVFLRRHLCVYVLRMSKIDFRTPDRPVELTRVFGNANLSAGNLALLHLQFHHHMNPVITGALTTTS